MSTNISLKANLFKSCTWKKMFNSLRNLKEISRMKLLGEGWWVDDGPGEINEEAGCG